MIMKKNAGYQWSAALLVCSVTAWIVFALVMVFSLLNPQSAFSGSKLARLIAGSGAALVNCLSLALAIAGMNAKKWKKQHTLGLFVLGLIDAVLFLLLNGTRLRFLSGSVTLDTLYALYGLAYLVCMLGYSFAFKIKKQDSGVTAE